MNMKLHVLGAVFLLFISFGCISTGEGGNADGIGSASDVKNGTTITIARWNITDEKYSYDELEAKYYELYNFSFPYLLKEYIKAQVIPTGVPAIYGDELNVSYDGDPNEMISILRQYEDATLDKELKVRYINIGSNISCEYCCSAKTLIFPDGTRACGCAHSSAMRGLAKYLLLNHPDEYTDEQVIDELAKWKTTYFPRQSTLKVFDNYVETNKIDPSILADMPKMVGNC